MSKYKVLGLFKGTKKVLSSGLESAIRKRSVETLEIKKQELPGDDVVDQKHHGGDMRVIHHYSAVNYNHLKKSFPDIADKFQGGTFGENLFTEELTEVDLCIGDIFMVGSAKLQLTVPRRPCSTINQGYEDNRILKEVISSGHVGWFYTVLEEGSVSVGDYLEHTERPFPNLRISDLYDQGYKAPRFSNIPFLQECFDTSLMDKGWMPKLVKALSLTGQD